MECIINNTTKETFQHQSLFQEWFKDCSLLQWEDLEFMARGVVGGASPNIPTAERLKREQEYDLLLDNIK